MEEFVEVLNQSCLIDQGFKGPKFTWTNRQRSSSNIQERLDRFLCTLSWNSMFPEAFATHLDYFGSDHRMITIDLHPPTIDGSFSNFRSQSFLFEPYWRAHGNFKQILTEFWESQDSSSTSSTNGFLEKLHACGDLLKIWGKDTFGCLAKRIRKLQNNIVQINQDFITDENTIIGHNLEERLDHLLALEESHWKQWALAD